MEGGRNRWREERGRGREGRKGQEMRGRGVREVEERIEERIERATINIYK